MAYPAGHRNEVRKKIVQSARRLFNRHGFDGATLKQIMAGAGLTHGGFYSYFASKSELYVEVLGCFFHRLGLVELLGGFGSGIEFGRRGAAGGASNT